MKNILVPSDFSNNAYCALFYATQLYKDKPCRFYILNAYDRVTPLKSKKNPRPRGKALLQQLSDESLYELTCTKHRIVFDNENSKHSYEIISEYGDLIDTISKVVIEKEIDLTVMGNKVKMGAKAVFFGSNVIRTVNRMKLCPVLVVPLEIDFKIPKEIAFVTDYERPYNASMLAPLQDIASLFDSNVGIMHIDTEKRLDVYQRSNTETLKKYLLNIGHSEHRVPSFSKKAEVIDVFLEEMEMDMLVMVNYEHSFFEKLFREPVINDVSFYTEIPFLIIPATA